MKWLLALLFTLPALTDNAQSKNKITFTIKSCTFSTNNKDYKPCQEDVTKRFVVLDMDNEKWIFYTKKTNEYKIIKQEKGKYENTSLDQITYQVLDAKNDALVFVFIYGTSQAGTSLYKLLKIGEQTTLYTLELFE